MKILVVDVGGSHVKCIATDHKSPVKFKSGAKLTPDRMVRKILKITEEWLFDAVSIGYPGVVRAVQRSGLWDAVEGRVLIYIHKERMLDDVEQRYPARHYVMVDDKLRILAAMKKIRRNRLTTVFPRQGHYALDPKNIAAYPPADITVERIGDLVNYNFSALLGAAKAGHAQ